MRTIKYHLVLTDNEYSLIINSLNNLRNDLIAQGRYTDAVDDALYDIVSFIAATTITGIPLSLSATLHSF
ncbi:MAG: hypothetical protein Q4C80_06455 [Bacillota bacterium]|nr:hypothetical protein [Bacillota bacterium]